MAKTKIKKNTPSDAGGLPRLVAKLIHIPYEDFEVLEPLGKRKDGNFKRFIEQRLGEIASAERKRLIDEG